MMASRISQQGGLIHQNPFVNAEEFLGNNPNSAELARMVKNLSEYKVYLEKLCLEKVYIQFSCIGQCLAIQVTEYQKELEVEIKLPEGVFSDPKEDYLQFSPLQTLFISYQNTNTKLSEQIIKYQKELQQMEETLGQVMRDNQEICQLELKNNKFLEFLQDSDFQSKIEQFDRELKLRKLEDENAQLADKFQTLNSDQMSLKKAVEESKQKYNELREKYKNLESKYYKQQTDFETLRNQYDQIKIKRTEDMEEKALAERNAEQYEESAKSMEKQMNKTKIICQRKEQQLQDSLNEKSDELTSLQYDYDQIKETNTESQKTIKQLENQIQKLEIEKKNHLEEISKLQYTNLDLQKNVDNLDYTKNQSTDQLELTEKSYQQLRQNYDKLAQEKDELELTKTAYEGDLQSMKTKLDDALETLKDKHEQDMEKLKHKNKEQVSKLEDKISCLDQIQVEMTRKNVTLEREKKVLEDQMNSLQNNVMETYIQRIKMLENNIDENQNRYLQDYEKKEDLNEETARHFKERNQQLEQINETYRQDLDNLLTEKQLISKKLERALDDKQKMLATFEKIKYRVKEKLGNNNDVFI